MSRETLFPSDAGVPGDALNRTPDVLLWIQDNVIGVFSYHITCTATQTEVITVQK